MFCDTVPLDSNLFFFSQTGIDFAVLLKTLFSTLIAIDQATTAKGLNDLTGHQLKTANDAVSFTNVSQATAGIRSPAGTDADASLSRAMQGPAFFVSVFS